ncbi:MAG: efflux RND transporter periplasmic adaptor subunit [Planctomycetota bacterium]
MSNKRTLNWKPWLTRLTVVAACAVVLFVAVALRAQTLDGQDARVEARKTLPLLVNVEPAKAVSQYTVSRQFIGRVEAARRTTAAFELAGTIEWIGPEEGDEVKAGDELARLDVSRLKARQRELEARITSALADLKLAEQTFRRTEEAAELDAIADQDLDDAARQVDASKAALRVAEASLETLQVDLDKSVLLAPYDAVISRKSADEGDVVSPGTAAMVLLDRQKPEVRIGLAGRSIESVRAGEVRTVRIAGQDVPAKVKSILPSRNGGARTVDAMLVLARPLDGIRDGDLAALIVDTTVEREGFQLPTAALIEGTRGLWSCYVAEPVTDNDDVNPDATHIVRRRELQLIQPGGDIVFVSGTLADGELVVIDGVHRLTPNLPVRIER